MAKNHQDAPVMTTHMKIKLSQAVRMVTTAIKAKVVPLIHGSPAIGKSAIGHIIAKQFNLLMIDIRLAQCDPTDLNGFPTINNGRAGYMPMDTFPIEGDELPINPETKEPYGGWLIFFDELTSASVAVQAASYKILLDRMVGKYKVHPKVAMMAAGNLETDGAIVEEMSTALQSRMVHMELMCDLQEWMKWAGSAGIDHRIMSYLEFQPSNLYTFKPDHTDRTYAAPRTWEFADRFLKLLDVKDPDLVPLLSGCITEGVARPFLTFCDIFDKLPTIAAIIAAPKAILVPDEPSVLFALCGSISDKANETNIAALLEFVMRLKLEFQIVAVRMTLARNTDFVNHPAMQNWLAAHAMDLF